MIQHKRLTEPPTTESTHIEQPAIPEGSIKAEPNHREPETAGKGDSQHGALQNTAETERRKPLLRMSPWGQAPTDAPLPQKKADSLDSGKAQVDPADSTKDEEDRVVRVSAGSLTRLVGLAGESLVEARQLRPFADSLLVLRESQTDLCDQITACEEKIRSAELPPSQMTLIESLRQRSVQSLDKLTKIIEAFEGFARRNEDLSERLHREVIFSRMRPLADGIHGFPRLVRDVSRQLNKAGSACGEWRTNRR